MAHGTSNPATPRPLLIALVNRPGRAAGAKAAAELTSLGCDCSVGAGTGATNGRVYFYGCLTEPLSVAKARQVERIGVVCLRSSEGVSHCLARCTALHPSRQFQPSQPRLPAVIVSDSQVVASEVDAPSAASAGETTASEAALAHISDAVTAVDWPAHLAAWAALVSYRPVIVSPSSDRGRLATGAANVAGVGGGMEQGGKTGQAFTFRCDAKRTSKVGKDELPSDLLTRRLEEAFEGHFNAHCPAGPVGTSAATPASWIASSSAFSPTVAAACIAAATDADTPLSPGVWRREPDRRKGVDLVITVRLCGDELLVFLPALVRPAGASRGYLAASGLHPSVAWALAKTAGIGAGMTVLDPMCGKGVVLCEAALGWGCKLSGVTVLGCDVDPAQLALAALNLAGARVDHTSSEGGGPSGSNGCVGRRGRGLSLADASRALPFKTGVVDRIITDLPFGKQFGSVEDNEALYPRCLAEFARVTKAGGVAVLLTSADNDATMRAALATTSPLPSSPTPAPGAPKEAATCDGSSSGNERPAKGARRSKGGYGGEEGSSGSEELGRTRVDVADDPGLSACWEVECRVGFMLFSTMRARVFVLRRTARPAPSPLAAARHCAEALASLKAHSAIAAASRPASSTTAAERNDERDKHDEGHDGNEEVFVDSFASALAGAPAMVGHSFPPVIPDSAASLETSFPVKEETSTMAALPALPPPKMFVHKLPGGRGKLPWDKGGPWNEQWLLERSGMEPFRRAASAQASDDGVANQSTASMLE